MLGAGYTSGFGATLGTTLSCNLNRVVKCRACGLNLAEEIALFDGIPLHFCTSCTDKETADQRNRILEQKNDELQDLQSRLTFLRLQPVSESPEHIQKCDTVIVVQGRTEEPLHAHRFVLSSRSHVFRTMFDFKMSEEETGIIYIDDATLPVIRAMIEFCYNAEIAFTDEVTAEEVLKVAHKYQIDLLQKICEKHLIKTVDNSNLPKRLRLAKKFEARELEVAATGYFKRHFDQAIGDVLAELC